MDNTQISCIRLVPYRQFADGTWGCILVLRWQSEDPSVFLFNSEARKKDSPNSTRNTFISEEADMYALYTEKEATITNLKEAYSRYGVARLCGSLVSAHIADLVSKNLNTHDSNIVRNEDRVRQMLLNIKDSRQASVYEEELFLHTDSKSEWQRAILEQILPLVVPGYNHAVWVQSTLLSVQKIAKRKNRLYKSQEESRIRAVYEAGICKSKSDWGAVFKILAERKIVSGTSYLAGSRIINQTCDKEVTTASAIKQSPALVILGGKCTNGWIDKVHNRQSANLLLHYQNIANVFLSDDVTDIP